MEKNYLLTILGAGESGTGAALLAHKQGLNVFVSDNNTINDKYKNVLKHFDIDFEENGHNERKIFLSNEVIKSPGIPDTIPLIINLKKKKIPIISEIEFAARYTNAKLICITGSNGKTTTTLLTYYIFKNAGFNIGLAGNVGKSFAWQVAEHDFNYYILEISSFQLDGMYNFKADIAVLLNITPDHLERYNYRFENYTKSKFRIIQNQTVSDYFIFNEDDSVINNELKKIKIKAQSVPISYKHKINNLGAWVDNNKVIFNNGINRFDMTLEQLALQGRHNVYNSMAAGIAAHLIEIRKQSIKQSLENFQNIAHRLEYVASVHGISFINDSKATNVNATWYALGHYDNKIVWIAGGIDKGNDYNTLLPLVKEKVKAIICLGRDNSKLHSVFEDIVEFMIDVKSMEEAVQEAYYAAKKGDTILLSPACSSFDLFKDFEERGELFKNAVRHL